MHDADSIVCAANGHSGGLGARTGDVIVCAGADSPDATSPSAGTLSAFSQPDGPTSPDDPVLRTLFECTSCYHALLDLYLTQYLIPRQTYYDEWYTSVERQFVAELSKLTALAKDYKIHPEDLDGRVNKEKRRWYIENLTSLRLKLLVEGDTERNALAVKVEEAAAGKGDLDELIDLVSEALPGLGADEWPEEVPAKLLAAENRDQKVGVLKDAFLSSTNHKGRPTIPRGHQKYVEMLEDGRSMEHVIDRILEESQKATNARKELGKAKARLEELRRGRAAHELQKKRKAQRRELAEKNKVPDVMYDLPPCATCRKQPNPRKFKACTICTLLVGNGVHGLPRTVFCSADCEKKGYPTHAATHKCASGSTCLHGRSTRKPKPQQRPGTRSQKRPPAPPLFRQAVTSGAPISGRNAMPIRSGNHHHHNHTYHAHNHDPSNNPHNPHNPHNHKGSLANGTSHLAPGPRDMRFCKECLLTLKKQTIFCCEACACQNYKQHCIDAHPSRRFRQGISGADAADDCQDPDVLTMFTTSYDHEVREWEGKYHVRLRRE
ncbi:hypothetical protein QBC35DRAFT_380818 [Podospora australis]|uniref:MYND-type zinc finger protein samB n=1 Tax=Podospora australis TaxID=1536484 RepID=A0AAN7AKC1_9PEZI|nr:hypothetical protein QBC35DRAFT_380818 [Podospora australis]